MSKIENKKEKEFNEEELRRLVIESFTSSQTIEEFLAKKREEEKNIKDSFNEAKSSCSTVLSYGNSVLFKLNKTIFLTNLLKIYSYIVENGQEELLDDLILKTQKAKSNIKNQKALIKDIREALVKLEKNNVADCNVEICTLIAYIFEKQRLILDEVIAYINICKLNVEGNDYEKIIKNQEELKELNSSIYNSIKSLGLRK